MRTWCQILNGSIPTPNCHSDWLLGLVCTGDAVGGGQGDSYDCTSDQSLAQSSNPGYEMMRGRGGMIQIQSTKRQRPDPLSTEGIDPWI
jgi:hypothetical protein